MDAGADDNPGYFFTWPNTGKYPVFVLFHMPRSEKLSLEAKANCLHGQVLSPPPGSPSFVNKVTLLPG